MSSTLLPQVLFATSHEKRAVAHTLLWLAIVTACVVANAPPRALVPLVVHLLQWVPPAWLTYAFVDGDLPTMSRTLVFQVIVPMKKLLFFGAISVLAYPVVKSLIKSAPLWKQARVSRIAWAALLLFMGLSLLVVPYGNPHGPFIHRAGLGGLGVLFGEMSIAPFASNNDIVYGRLLKPALAHFLHADGYARYYLFSMVCTYVLIFLTVFFFETRSVNEVVGNQATAWPSGARWPLYFSLMTSSFIMTSFQSPGKVDHLVFIFVLLMACLPLSPQARLGLIVLCTLTHEAIALALVPVIVLWFPKEERWQAVAAIGVFFAAMAASYGLDPSKALAGHGSAVNEGSVWQVVLAYPGYFLIGLFFSYKLFWGLFFFVLWRLWATYGLMTALQLGAITLFPILLCILAWDTSRIAGVGFLGMLVAIIVAMKDFQRMPALNRHLLMVAVCANAVIPSYNVILYPPVDDGPPIYLNSLAEYPYLGLYKVIHSSLRTLLS